MFHTPSLHYYKQHVCISFAQTRVCEIKWLRFNKMGELQRVVAFDQAVMRHRVDLFVVNEN